LFLVWRKNVQVGVSWSVEMHVVTPDADARIVALGRRQHGVVTAEQLGAAGVSRNAVTAREARGWLRRIHRGVYVVGALESPLSRPAAALLALGPAAVLSHRTAATIWGLLPTRPADPIHVTLLNANRRSRHGVEIHHSASVDTRTRHGLRVTSPARTLADLAATNDDLDRALNEAQVLRLVSAQELAAVGRRGVRALRAALDDLVAAGERVIRVTNRQLTSGAEALIARLAVALAPAR
jgi:predicted transcriptional regulator of viral defense system